MSNIPNELKYSKEHEWVRLDGQVATIGITDHAQSELGDIVYIELPKSGSEIAAMGTFGLIESVKAASDLFCPMAGKITEANEDLETAPEKINEDPYGEGWIIKVELGNVEDLNDLMDGAGYQAFLDSQV